MKKIIVALIKLLTFGFLLMIVSLMTFATDPNENAIIRLIGFFTVIYWIGNLIYPERFKEKDDSLRL